MSTLDIIVIAVLIASILWLWRQYQEAGHLTTTAWVFIGATSIWWLEAPWDWLLFVRYNPDLYSLMPVDIPILGMANGLPWVTALVYGPWFTIPPFFLAWWMAKRGYSIPQITLAAVVMGAVDEAVLEIILFIQFEVYAYSYVIPGTGVFEGTANQYPLDVPLWMAPTMALAAVSIARGIKGQIGSDGLMNLRCFGGQRDSVWANLIWVTVFNHAIYIFMMIPALLIRYEQWRLSPAWRLLSATHYRRRIRNHFISMQSRWESLTMKRPNGSKRLNNNSLKPLLNRTIGHLSGKLYHPFSETAVQYHFWIGIYC
jgi:hypothetical protein